ncbi:MAG: CHASE2 domain-containing protein [Bdellovibrionales bacterium]|nr:CHASE2 domain-containing protein [Bdellovibrionales bacterium]
MKSIVTSKKNIFVLIRIMIAMAIAIGISFIDLEYLEHWTYDFRTRIKIQPEVSGHIQTVAIDNPTVLKYKGEPGASIHSEFLNKLKMAEPKMIIYLLDLNNLEGGLTELKHFADIAKQTPYFVATTSEIIGKGQESELFFKPPLDGIKAHMALLTHDRSTFARDGVTRRLILSYLNTPMIHETAASHFNEVKKVDNYQGQFQFLNSQQSYINFRKTGTYKPLSFKDVVDNKFNPGALRDKIILVGRDTLVHAGDYKMTPFSRDIIAMSNMEVHANIIETLIQNNSPIRAQFWINIILNALIALITIYAVFRTRPSKGLMILIITLSAYVTLSWMSFQFFDYWLNMAAPLLTIFICYYFFIPYRLIMENKKSWEYFQHNKVLSEVEELKTNFLRMMSHDLKTPLARIHGMTEMALRHEGSTPEQQTALKNISKSSEELSLFVESILDLSRIESNEVKLHLQSKDINDLIKQVIQQSEYLAKEKGIKIIAELEPLFSIKVDPHLLKQVFTNLVENAIKYSPENTKVLVTTEEIDGYVVIQVADQGMGIPEQESKLIFDRFYRSKSASSSKIAGTGLGLYLTKYFVGLHKGEIYVESSEGLGSTFVVRIPTHLEIQTNNSIKGELNV